MTDAYRCDRCGEYSDGNGRLARVGKEVRAKAPNYRWHLEDELCGDCYHELQDVVDEFMGETA